MFSKETGNYQPIGSANSFRRAIEVAVALQKLHGPNHVRIWDGGEIVATIGSR